jgi:hypothetical protein
MSEVANIGKLLPAKRFISGKKRYTFYIKANKLLPPQSTGAVQRSFVPPAG